MAPFALLCLRLAAGCSGAASEPVVYHNPELPAVSELDELRGRQASAFVSVTADVGSPMLSGYGAAAGNTWAFTPQADGHSWALYALAAPVGSPTLSLQILGSTRLWVVVADHARNRWVQPQTLGTTTTQVDLQTVGLPVSPTGFVYCAVILPEGVTGVDTRLLHLSLRSDGQAAPQVHYVAMTADGGDDANPGTEQQPWATLQHAADVVQPGEGVCVLPGQYVGFMLQTSGQAGQPIVFAAQPGVRIVDSNMNAANGNGHTPDGINLENWSAPPAISYVTIEGFTIDGDDFPVRPRAGIRTAGSDTDFAHHITLLNNRCLNCDLWGIFDGHANDVLYEGNECAGSIEEHGIYHSNSGDRATIRGNLLHANNACGLHMNGDASAGGDGIISECHVENNIVYDNGSGGGSGINCDGVQNSFFVNNLLYDNRASGISLYCIDAAEPAKGNFITNNTVVMATDSSARWCINIQPNFDNLGLGGSTGATLRNNILINLNPNRGAINIHAATCMTGFTSDFNIVTDMFTPDDDTNSTRLTLAEWRAQYFQDLNSSVATAQGLFFDLNGILAEDYLLKPGSPARDAGGLQNAPNADLRGVPRKQGPKFDVGCFEMD